MMLKRVLLTGASGTIGKEVLNLLWDKRENYEISVLLRKSKKNERNIKPFRDDLNIIWGNITKTVKGTFYLMPNSYIKSKTYSCFNQLVLKLARLKL